MSQWARFGTHEYYSLTKFRQNRIKKKIFITRTFFVNKQLTLFFNYLKKYPLNFAQNFRKCSFNLVGSESGEKSTWFENFAYINQLFFTKYIFGPSFVVQDTEMLGPSTHLS